MFSTKAQKYTLGKPELVTFQLVSGTSITRRVRRITSLRSIPFHGVKPGDVGGYVEDGKTLSHEHCAWIADNAFVGSGCTVMGNALFKDNAIGLDGTFVSGHAVISGNAEVRTSHVRHDSIVSGKAFVSRSDISGTTMIEDDAAVFSTSTFGTVHIKDTASVSAAILASGDSGVITIEDNASISNHSHLEGTCTLSKNAKVKGAVLMDDVLVTDDSQVLDGAKVWGTSRITGKSVVPANFHMDNIVIHNQVAEYSTVLGVETPSSNKAKLYIEGIKEIEAEYESYTTDLVKLLKYPAMADYSIPETHALSVALRSAQRAVKANDEDDLKVALKELEAAFSLAENTARKITLSYLDDEKKDSLNKAQNCFAIASNEASSDNEKKISFKAGLKSLEGIIPVSDDAIFLFKKNAGLLELETLATA